MSKASEEIPIHNYDSGELNVLMDMPRSGHNREQDRFTKCIIKECRTLVSSPSGTRHRCESLFHGKDHSQRIV